MSGRAAEPADGRDAEHLLMRVERRSARIADARDVGGAAPRSVATVDASDRESVLAMPRALARARRGALGAGPPVTDGGIRLVAFRRRESDVGDGRAVARRNGRRQDEERDVVTARLRAGGHARRRHWIRIRVGGDRDRDVLRGAGERVGAARVAFLHAVPRSQDDVRSDERSRTDEARRPARGLSGDRDDRRRCGIGRSTDDRRRIR